MDLKTIQGIKSLKVLMSIRLQYSTIKWFVLLKHVCRRLCHGSLFHATGGWSLLFDV